MSVTNPRILLVEDEAPLRRYLRIMLQSHGYYVEEAASEAEARPMMERVVPDVVLLDLGLPDGDGLELVRVFRAVNRVPIIVLSARGREEDKVQALDLGADDYLAKPFGTSELLARIRVVLRHAAALSGAITENVLVLGPLQIDFSRREVSFDQAPIHLSPHEYALLAALAGQMGKVLTHRQLLRDVWGGLPSAKPHYLRVCMAGLRKKIEPDPNSPRFLITEPGVGYRLKMPSP